MTDQVNQFKRGIDNSIAEEEKKLFNFSRFDDLGSTESDPDESKDPHNEFYSNRFFHNFTHTNTRFRNTDRSKNPFFIILREIFFSRQQYTRHVSKTSDHN
ncbi:hypothetical protein M153_2650003060 [Pseudoloma neurophilia]|uniref:Uncharacterized protein n=1 Tax=Pseudoloma neurophilia TaxID=146866 RepID=A0A0R0M4Q2_9MICR|nr:hypothetical protein M153_2650003060 [Pseudoloma neurophilia]